MHFESLRFAHYFMAYLFRVLYQSCPFYKEDLQRDLSYGGEDQTEQLQESRSVPRNIYRERIAPHITVKP